ncbi:class IIb bacteriocin, lactobin A/cerein 7B family [Streptococcus sp. 27098_8_22]|uniref:class IIb bacteriocin, lactobin A/cerein 7B family n=1 Tax=Streptococcus sp. 27098_8_22 TaxID=3003665 RepID=UPI00352D94FA
MTNFDKMEQNFVVLTEEELMKVDGGVAWEVVSVGIAIGWGIYQVGEAAGKTFYYITHP